MSKGLSFNRDSWNKRSKERESRGGGSFDSSFAKPPKGVSYWKLLPRNGSDNPLYDPTLYFGYKKADGAFTVYKGLDENCPLLARFKKLKKAGKDKLADKYKPKRVYHYNAVNAKTGELVILQVGQQVQDEIDDSFEDRPSTFNPFSIKNSSVLKIKRKGNSWKDTKYKAKFVKMDDIELPEDLDLENLSSIDGIHEEFTREELLAMIKGKTPKSKRSKKGKEDEEDDEQDEEEVDEESEESDEDEEEKDEEVEDDEDEDEDDDEDEEDDDEDEDEDEEDDEDDEEFEKAKKELESDL